MLMVIGTKETGEKVRLMAMDFIYMQVEPNIMGNG
jgi:hypothetical protein